MTMRLLRTGTEARASIGSRDVSLQVSRSDTPYQTLKLKKVVSEAIKGAQRERAIKRAFKSVD